MLKDIRLHIYNDDIKQAEIETEAAEQMVRIQNESHQAILRHIPSLVPFLQIKGSKNISVLANKAGELNIVDYGLGRTLYGLNPKDEVINHIKNWCKHPTLVDTHTLSENETDSIHGGKPLAQLMKEKLSQPALSEKSDCVVVLGIGAGFHLHHLIEHYDISHVIIYEPEAQYFLASTRIMNWKTILEKAHQKRINLYLQLGKDGRDLVADINQLQDAFGTSNFYLYKHYSHEIFDSLELQLNSSSWHEITKNGLKFKETSYNDYCPVWTSSIDLSLYRPIEKSARFTDNLKAFRKYFPEIYNEFSDFTPLNWSPVEKVGEDKINLINRTNLTSWYGEDVKDECQKHFENFSRYPNKDGLALHYTGKKLAHYQHNVFVKKAEELLNKVEEVRGNMPDKVQSIIMFGIGLAYQLELMMEKHEVENLFICEPNRDFFYSSLFAIDWANILKKIDSTKARLYINVGDDGSNLFHDLLNQFYSVGPYLLNNTYFYIGYYNARLNSAIAQLREKLKIVISMGENFDHAYYGISHTMAGFERNVPVLRKSPHNFLTDNDKSVPIFIIGNGPSIDGCFEAIKEWQNHAIIVSCGTTLKGLHKHGICPDIHAEIEQTRNTYDWPLLLDDAEYLKRISLLSCNGVHPDTISLFKDTFIAFKEGESSTVSTQIALGENRHDTLTFAFPTVANLAVSFFNKLKYKSIYLIGIDLGFVDKNKHHSSHSNYYSKSGEEIYDYSMHNNTSLMVPGNFRPFVNTKPEFKISRELIEQAIREKSKQTEFYNCSDGAKILGTTAVYPDQILITSDSTYKKLSLHRLKHECFELVDKRHLLEQFDKCFNRKLMLDELEALEGKISTKVTNFSDAEELISSSKDFLFDSYRRSQSLLFFYFFGTMNFANAMLTKLLYSSASRDNLPEVFHSGQKLWVEAFIKMKESLEYNDNPLDYSQGSRNILEWMNRIRNTEGSTILIVTNSNNFVQCIKAFHKDAHFLSKIVFCDYNSLPDDLCFTHVIYHRNCNLPQIDPLNLALSGNSLPKKGTEQTFIISLPDEVSNLTTHVSNQPDATFLQFLFENQGLRYLKTEVDVFFMAKVALMQSTINHNCDVIINSFNTLSTVSSANFVGELTISQEEIHECILFSDYASINLQQGKRRNNNNPNSLGTLGSKTRDCSALAEHLMLFCDTTQLTALQNYKQSLVTIDDDSIFYGYLSIERRGETNVKEVLQLQ